MQENKVQIPFYTSLKERGPQPGKIGPKREENKDKPKSNYLIFANTHIDPLKRSKGVDPPKMGQFGLTCGPHRH